MLDANIAAAYYDERLLSKKPLAAQRIRCIIDSVRTKARTDIRLLIPNLCVAEVFNVFSKSTFPKWTGDDRKRQNKQTMLDRRVFRRIFDQFANDIHNGGLLEQIELSRYHVLARHFVAPIDHNFRWRRTPNGKMPSRQQLGASDQLIAGMAIWLARLFGHERFTFLTCDARLAAVLRKGAKTTEAKANRWGLNEIEDAIGLRWSQAMYPRVVDLQHIEESELVKLFGQWPLPKKRHRKPKTVWTNELKSVLLDQYQRMKVGRDVIPYSKHMRRLRRGFRSATGITVPEQELWRRLLNALKKGNPGSRQAKSKQI